MLPGQMLYAQFVCVPACVRTQGLMRASVSILLHITTVIKEPGMLSDLYANMNEHECTYNF